MKDRHRKNRSTYVIDDEKIIKAYAKSFYKGISTLTHSKIVDVPNAKPFSSIKYIIILFEEDIERDIEDTFLENEELAEHSLNVYREKGASRVERIGRCIDIAVRSPLFEKYLSLLASTYIYNSSEDYIKSYFFNLFTKNRYEARRRLLECKDVLPKDSAFILSNFIRKKCSSRKLAFDRKLANEIVNIFDETFREGRINVRHNIYIEIHLSERGKFRGLKMSCKEVNDEQTLRGRNGIIFLTLLHNVMVDDKRGLTYEDVNAICKRHNFSISWDPAKRMKKIESIISNIRTRNLRRLTNLKIKGGEDSSRDGWKLLAPKNYVKIFILKNYDKKIRAFLRTLSRDHHTKRS